jgi:hypothetical protein
MVDALAIESLMATIGVESILKARPKLPKYAIKRAADYPKKIRRRVLKFLATSEFTEASDYPPLDYRALLELVSAGQTPEQAAALFAAVPDHEMATDLGIEAGRVITWANTAIPRQSRDSLAGPQVDEPDPQSLAQFQSLWEVACDPMVVLRDLAEGCLTPEQISTVALLYPSLYGEMRQAVTDAMVAMAGRKGRGWEPSDQKAAMVKLLRQEDGSDPTLAAAIQAIYDKQPEPAQMPKTKKGAGEDPDEQLTPGQRAST